MHRRRLRDRREIGRTVRAGPDLVQRRQVEDPTQVRDTACVHDRGAHVVDELLGDQLLDIPDRTEHLANRDRRRGVLSDQPERLLVLRRGRVLHPEQPAVLDSLAEPGGLDGREPVVYVVQQVEVEPEPVAHGLEIGGREVQIGLGGPRLLVGQRGRRWLVDRALPHPVGAADVRDGGLGPHGPVAEVAEARDIVEQRRHVGAAGVGVDEHAVPDRPPRSW